MANFEALNDDVLEAANGGAAKVNTTNAYGAHWQPTNRPMGQDFVYDNRLWYRVKTGDTLGAIAQKYGTTPQVLKNNNSQTIKNINQIYAGDALCIRHL